MDPLDEQRQALREYFIKVIRNLAARGMLRVAKGQTLEQVLVKESGSLLKELQADVKIVLGNIGVELLGGAANILGGVVQRKVEMVLGDISKRVTDALKAPR